MLVFSNYTYTFYYYPELLSPVYTSLPLHAWLADGWPSTSGFLSFNFCRSTLLQCYSMQWNMSWGNHPSWQSKVVSNGELVVVQARFFYCVQSWLWTRFDSRGWGRGSSNTLLTQERFHCTLKFNINKKLRSIFQRQIKSLNFYIEQTVCLILSIFN